MLHPQGRYPKTVPKRNPLKRGQQSTIEKQGSHQSEVNRRDLTNGSYTVLNRILSSAYKYKTLDKWPRTHLKPKFPTLEPIECAYEKRGFGSRLLVLYSLAMMPPAGGAPVQL